MRHDIRIPAVEHHPRESFAVGTNKLILFFA